MRTYTPKTIDRSSSEMIYHIIKQMNPGSEEQEKKLFDLLLKFKETITDEVFNNILRLADDYRPLHPDTVRTL